MAVLWVTSVLTAEQQVPLKSTSAVGPRHSQEVDSSFWREVTASEGGSVALKSGLRERAFVAQACVLARGQGRPDHFRCSVLN